MEMLLNSRSHHMQVRGKNKVKHEQAQGKSLKEWFLLRIGLDTMLNCIELTKE